MKTRFFQPGGPFGSVRCLLALICTLLLVPGDSAVYAQAPPPAAKTEPEEPKIPNDQLDSLVAPIALYPDPLLAQMLAASTYPLEIIQLQQWLLKNKNLKDKALVEAVQKENWDASVQGLAGLPDAVKQLAENIKWSTDLGNAFLAQQGDVMDAVQRMRQKAQAAGNLKSTEQQKVETKVVESKSVVVIQQAKPEVVYVPSYNPTVVYGPPVYPYPPIAYPPPGAYAATAAVSFGVGMMVGAAMSGGWGYNAGWGGGGNNTVNINNNNNFVNNSNKSVSGGNRTNVSGGSNKWQHNAQHRGGAPYSNQATANKFGGTSGGASQASRQGTAGQRGGGQQAGSTNRGGGGGSGSRQQPSAANRGGGGGNSIGNRSVSSSASSRGSGAFGGGGSSGSSARASSSRGASSMSSRSSGGGGSRGGGGGGGSRGGGGGRRR